MIFLQIENRKTEFVTTDQQKFIQTKTNDLHLVADPPNLKGSLCVVQQNQSFATKKIILLHKKILKVVHLNVENTARINANNVLGWNV